MLGLDRLNLDWVTLARGMAYIPQVEDAIWHEFSRTIFWVERLLWDAEQCEYLPP
jgi:hypothetical protein